MVYNVPAGGRTSGWNPWVYTFADPLPFGATITGVDLTFTAVDQGWGGTGANANMYFADTYIGSGVLYHSSMTHTLNYDGAVPAYNYGGNNTLKLYHVGWPGWVAYWQGGTLTIHYRTSDDCEAYVEVTPPQLADNCSGLTLTNNLNGTASATGSYPIGVTEVEWTVTDGSGNTAVCTQQITVIDNTPPDVLTNNIVVALDDFGQAGIYAEDIDAGSTDNCGVASLIIDVDQFDCSNVGENTVTLTVTDIHENSASTTAIVTIEDNVAPVALAQDLTIQLDAGGQASITPEMIDNGSNDDCGIKSLALSQSNFDCAHVGPNTVTLTVTDVNGNVSTVDVIVTVQDVTPPVVLVKDITVQLDANGQVAFSVNEIDNGSYDVCGIANSNMAQTPLTCENVGANEITLVLTDVNGNTASATANVTVEDNVAPVALAQDFTIQLDELGAASITPEMVDNGSNDACGIASLSLSQLDFDCSHVGSNTVTLTVTDVNGNVSTVDAVVTVEDNVAPVALCQNLTLQLDANGEAFITSELIDNGSNDACGIASLEVSQTDFTCDHVGDNVITLAVTDVNGNVSNCFATVTIQNDRPVIDAYSVSPLINIAETVYAEAMFTDVNLASVDFNWGNGVVTSGTINGNMVYGEYVYPETGLYDVTVTITDVCGETDTETFSYVVIYDPCAGHVTGGGYLPDRNGKKNNFGLNAKYDKESLLPKGMINYHDKDESIHFKGEQVDWLMVNGEQAVYSGYGTINDAGNYRYIVSIVDEGVSGGRDDYFRIIIYDEASVVYDTQAGDYAGAFASLAIGNGSIKIHKGCGSGETIAIKTQENNRVEVKNKANGVSFSKASVELYPNPVVNTIHLRFTNLSDQLINYQITEMSGKIYLLNQAINIEGGNAQINIGELNLKKGNYMLILRNEDNSYSESKVFLKK